MTRWAPRSVPKSWWDLEDPTAFGFSDGEQSVGVISRFGGLGLDFLRKAVDRSRGRRRRPLQQRAGSVKRGEPQKFRALVAGDTAWCPATAEALRVVHLTGPLAWHTSRRGYNPAQIPVHDIRPAALRWPNPADELESYAADRSHWLVLDLESPGGRAKFLADGADLALLGLVAEWSFPPVRWWT